LPTPNLTFLKNHHRAAFYLLVLGLVPMASVLRAQPRPIVWGDNFYGQTNLPAGLIGIKAIAAGYYHCLALRSNGTVVAWGDNQAGQTNVPGNLSDVMAVAAGQYHSLALRSNGTVVAWGLNTFGQTNVPGSAVGVAAIAAGASHCMALLGNGTVIAWGNNFSGQTNVPPGLSGVTAISAGDTHCLALKSDGTLAAWGDNDSGQSTIPGGLTNIKAIAAGYHHNLAVRSNGTVVAWELNVYGESTVPPGLSNVIAVAGGYFYSMALKNDGTVIAWGDHNSGKTNVPVGLTNVFAIASHWETSMALTPTPICPPGLPDNFECRALLVGSNVSFSVSNVNASSEPGEPPHFGFQDAGKSLWYSWTAPFSGGVVIVANSDFPTPCLAAYIGTNLAGLSPLASNNTAFSQSRVVFTAQAGSNYQVAVDGTTFGGSPGSGNLNVSLKLQPPPAHDSFSNRTVLSTLFYETTNSFIGATQEPGEPAHTANDGNAAFGQTVWWSWSVPTNLQAATIPVQLIAEGVSFPPNLGVYTGSVVSNLSAVPLSSATNGMTRVAGFIAQPGTAYQIALGGMQYDPVGVNASPRFGEYYFRLNVRALVLSFGNISSTVNGDASTSFSADLQVTNYGTVASAALRLNLSAVSGVSVLGQDSGFTTNSQVALLTTNLPVLSPGQGLVRRVSGVVPPPIVNGSVTLGVGYGAYGQLQESAGTNWLTLDQALVLFGAWPDLNGNQGPGGGVIRLDPGLTGAGFNPLTNVTVIGPPIVVEGSSANYFGRARYANGFQVDFTNTVWTSTRFSITNGFLSAGIVASNTPDTLTAQYSSGGFLYNANANVLVLDLPSPRLAVAGVTGGNLNFQVQGVSNRLHVIEAADALTNPIVWIPIGTNALDANGLWTFAEPIGINRAQRFYRARETQ
jgi:hypothetical protein